MFRSFLDDYLFHGFLSMAARRGFEPQFLESEASVLPLDERAIILCVLVLLVA